MQLFKSHISSEVERRGLVKVENKFEDSGKRTGGSAKTPLCLLVEMCYVLYCSIVMADFI